MCAEQFFKMHIPKKCSLRMANVWTRGTLTPYTFPQKTVNFLYNIIVAMQGSLAPLLQDRINSTDPTSTKKSLHGMDQSLYFITLKRVQAISRPRPDHLGFSFATAF